MRDLDKCNYYNFPNYRSLFESVLNIHVLEALKELQKSDISDIYIIGGLAVSYYSKPYRSSDIDILVKDKSSITSSEYLDIYEPSDLGIPIEQFDDIAKTCTISDNFNIVSPSHLMCLLLSDYNGYMRAIDFLFDNLSFDENIIKRYSGGYDEYCEHLIYSKKDYNMNFTKKYDKFMTDRIFEGISGFPEVDSAFDDWLYYTKGTNQVLIGGMALLNHINVKDRTTSDADFIFISECDTPTEVTNFVKNRAHSFKHKRTHVEIETLTPDYINLEDKLVKLIFDTAYKKDGYSIASPSAIVALKLDRLSKKDISDIRILVENFDVDITIFKPFLSRKAVEGLEYLKKSSVVFDI